MNDVVARSVGRLSSGKYGLARIAEGLTFYPIERQGHPQSTVRAMIRPDNGEVALLGQMPPEKEKLYGYGTIIVSKQNLLDRKVTIEEIFPDEGTSWTGAARENIESIKKNYNLRYGGS